ncbi:MAG: YhdH/YhfP family quinone oxidoreductase [Ignavibacteriaceae bacterium]
MNDKQFKAIIVKESDEVKGKFIRSVSLKNISELPAGSVLIKVKYTALNYKDALSATGNKGVTRRYPHTPGIDAAGIIEETSDKIFKEGDEVLVTGYDLGMNTSGGFAEYIRVPAEWVLKLPEGLNLKESMILGTAGFTAALSLYKLELNGLKKENGEVLVTGATGGVGSLAAAILSKNGYDVAASTGKMFEKNYLTTLGAKRIISREEATDHSYKPMISSKWAAVIDTVGGNILETAIASTKMSGSVASCGRVQSPEFSTTVYPFILRGINLLGINSAETTMDLRLYLWNKLSSDWKPDVLNDICTEHSLEELNNDIDLILQGKVRGRIVARL